jgi:hypothetical protein
MLGGIATIITAAGKLGRALLAERASQPMLRADPPGGTTICFQPTPPGQANSDVTYSCSRPQPSTARWTVYRCAPP